jgi:hypothetical protein
MSAVDLITGFIGSNGAPLGVTLNGFTFIPFNQSGIVMADANAVLWLLQIGTDGRLQTSQVTF